MRLWSFLHAKALVKPVDQDTLRVSQREIDEGNSRIDLEVAERLVGDHTAGEHQILNLDQGDERAVLEQAHPDGAHHWNSPTPGLRPDDPPDHIRRSHAE